MTFRETWVDEIKRCAESAQRHSEALEDTAISYHATDVSSIERMRALLPWEYRDADVVEWTPPDGGRLMALTRVRPPTSLMTSSQRALAIATDIRSVGANASDAHTLMGDAGRPDDWSGDAASAAEHAATIVTNDLDSVVATMERASLAFDDYAGTLASLEQRKIDLDEEVPNLNGRIDEYDRDARLANADPGADIDALDARYAALELEADALQARVERWEQDAQAAHQRVVIALRGIDTVLEGDMAARSAGRPDAEVLAGDLRTLVAGGDPEATARFWDSLSPEARQAVMIHSPHLVGNANGVAAADRDVANRTALQSDIDYLTQREADDQLSRNERHQLANARDTRDVLADYGADIDPATGEHLAHLLVYKPGDHGGNGGVAVSLGNPDTADDVSALVPGLTSDQSSLRGNLESMERLRARTDDLNGDRTTATIAWIDYNAPSGNPFSVDGFLDHVQDVGDLAMVTNELQARAGGERFADFVSGLRASDQGERAHFTAIGHSYGSTTVAHAAAGGMDVDDLVLAGSPGAGGGNAHASDLMANGNVWVGSAEFDPVTHLGNPSPLGLGHDPAQRDFGAHRFAVDPGSFRVQDLLDNHVSYFDERSVSLENIARISAGQEPDLVGGRTVPGSQTLQPLVTGSTAASGAELVGDAAGWTAGQVDDAARWTAGQVSDGAGWVYERGQDGASWLGDRWDVVERALDPQVLVPPLLKR